MNELIIDELRRKQNDKLLTILEEEQQAETVIERGFLFKGDGKIDIPTDLEGERECVSYLHLYVG